ncbi:MULTISPECIES: response regulator [Spirulina sp. CCY15215]|uniref:hybrid sensor histidine kinase/response regulator n=1 Tax=Spirulina sp. CCY15215 TaxID=2767591 RepID=UPI0019512444|nr:response regulator [Spirulina major]
MNNNNLPLGQIAVVDDTTANLHLLSNLLEGAGYDIRLFPRGKLALEGIVYSLPDLILLDIQMPEMNGYEVCEKLKVDELTRNIPVIFISALNETFDKVKAFQVGGVDYISKPFQAEEVLARVATHLQLYQMKKKLQETNIIQAQQLTLQNHQLLELNQALEKANRELQNNYEKLQYAQLQLVQTEKMATIGNLVAGVAHEINNPVGFISGNISVAQEYLQDLLSALALYQQKCPLDLEFAEELEDLDLDFIAEDFPKLIASMQSGCDRIASISTSLRTFSRTDTDKKTEFNLHEGLESTILILKYRLKANEERPAINIIKNYGHLPEIKCYPGQLNQVFMNILSNAIDALDESNEGKTYEEIEKVPNCITIDTKLSENKKNILVSITDNGMGMPEEVKARIFEQGFTTKEVGKGTGLGMAIARQIIVEKHGGAIACHSELGKGTEFVISLPLS